MNYKLLKFEKTAVLFFKSMHESHTGTYGDVLCNSPQSPFLQSDLT